MRNFTTAESRRRRLMVGRRQSTGQGANMFYLIESNKSLVLDSLNVSSSFDDAKALAEERKANTGINWEVVQVRVVYTTQTFDEVCAEIDGFHGSQFNPGVEP
jgi:hypothetical protein